MYWINSERLNYREKQTAFKVLALWFRVWLFCVKYTLDLPEEIIFQREHSELKKRIASTAWEYFFLWKWLVLIDLNNGFISNRFYQNKMLLSIDLPFVFFSSWFSNSLFSEILETKFASTSIVWLQIKT